MAGRVIVVGSVNIDLVVTAPRLPAPGETVTGGTFAQHDGGKGGNQAVAAARAGASTAFVGAVGNDAFGARAREALAAAGVDVSELATLPEPTGVALIVVGSGGENLIAVASGANAGIDARTAAASIARLGATRGDVVLVGHEIPTATARAALAAGRAAGATTVLNPAPATGIDRSLFGLADVLTPNRGELAAIVSTEAILIGRRARAGDLAAAARSLVERNAQGPGAAAVMVSLGERGALLVRPGTPPEEIPAPVVKSVDSTGAGDVLSGALAAGLAAGLPLDKAARAAVTAASRSTERPGARG